MKILSAESANTLDVAPNEYPAAANGFNHPSTASYGVGPDAPPCINPGAASNPAAIEIDNTRRDLRMLTLPHSLSGVFQSDPEADHPGPCVQMMMNSMSMSFVCE
jgi:hypothetical protein